MENFFWTWPIILTVGLPGLWEMARSITNNDSLGKVYAIGLLIGISIILFAVEAKRIDDKIKAIKNWGKVIPKIKLLFLN